MIQRLRNAPWRHAGWMLAGLLVLAVAIRVLYAREYVQRPEFRHPTFDAQYHEYWAKALARPSAIAAAWTAEFPPQPASRW